MNVFLISVPSSDSSKSVEISLSESLLSSTNSSADSFQSSELLDFVFALSDKVSLCVLELSPKKCNVLTQAVAQW